MCAGGFHWSHSCVSVRTLGTKPKLCSGEIYIPTKCPPVEFYRDDSSKFTNARARAMGEHLKKQPGKQEEQEESPTPTNQMNPTVSMLQSSRCFDLEYPKQYHGETTVFVWQWMVRMTLAVCSTVPHILVHSLWDTTAQSAVHIYKSVWFKSTIRWKKKQIFIQTAKW